MATFSPPTARMPMNAAPTEKIPLLPPILVNYDALPSTFRFRSQSYQINTLLCAVVRLHWSSLLSSAISAGFYWYCRGIEDQIIITLAFAALLLGTSAFMVFRSARGSDRRMRALQAMNKMFAAFWSIYTFLPNASRENIRGHFIATFKAIARHVSVVSDHGNYWYTIMGLAPANHRQRDTNAEESRRRRLFNKVLRSGSDANLEVDQNFEAVPAPRLQLLATLMLVEEENSTDWRDVDVKRFQNMRGHLWHSKALLLEGYDELVTLVIPTMGNAQIALHNVLMFLVSIMLPWAVPPKYLHMFKATEMRRYLVKGSVFLCADICLVMLLYTLDVLTQVYDNPFVPSAVSDQISLEDCVEVLSLSVEGYDERHRMAEQQYGAACLSSQTFQSFMCAQQKHKNVEL
jgi:hypothetical protein